MSRARFLDARMDRIQSIAIDGAIDLVWRAVATGDVRVTAPTIRIDPGESTRTVDLPPEAESPGVTLTLANTETVSGDLTVRNAGGTGTIVTIAPGEVARVYCDGTTWSGGLSTAT